MSPKWKKSRENPGLSLENLDYDSTGLKKGLYWIWVDCHSVHIILSIIPSLRHNFVYAQYHEKTFLEFEQGHKISNNVVCMCDQQRLRPACAYAQSDQSLCWLLEYSMTVKLLTKQHLEFLSLKGGCRGSFGSTTVKMPHCWKSHVKAHLIFCQIVYIFRL